LLTEDETHHLSTRCGTITREERQIMNDHMVHTVNMLESMPWPRHLQRVPEYACGHHEKMDGTGYPRGLLAGTMSIPARMMAIADVFEALTAVDRPYKKPKKLSEALAIIGQFKKNNHLDPNIVDFFITSKTYRKFAEMFLDHAQIDEVDEASILAIQPEPMQMKQAPKKG
jgi:HD-GYP domain-containing protein (c-di-GMP phosphodiesterase class II)